MIGTGEKKLNRGAAVLRAVLGWGVLCAGVGLSVTLSQVVGEWASLGEGAEQILQAILVTCLVVPTIVILRRRVDRRGLAGMGLGRGAFGAAVLGIAIGLVSGAVVWAPALWAGWIRVEHIDAGSLFAFLAVNTVVLVLYEALPEEVALRGYAWTSVREAWTPLAATVVVTVLFCLGSTLISVVQTVSAMLLRTDAMGVALAPGGGDPIAYLVQIVAFGLALVAARRLPLRSALVVAIAFHLAQLTVTRVLLGGLGWIDSGVGVQFVEPDAIALVIAHIAVAGACFVLIRLWMQRRTRPSGGAG